MPRKRKPPSKKPRFNRQESRFIQLRNACLTDLDEARRLVIADPGLLEARNGTGETALHWLAVENQLQAVTSLTEWGADAETQDDFEATPLMNCVTLNYTALVTLFLSKGASVTHKDSAGRSAILIAAEQKGPDMLRLVLPALHPRVDINSLFEDWDADRALDREDEVSALLTARGLKRREEF